jgi:hypothetical protein
MRSLVVVVFALAGTAFGQGLTEYGAAAAGGAAGGAAGKKVSDGISNIFGKVDQQTKEAAKGKAPAKQKPAEAAPATSAAPAPVAAPAGSTGPAGGGAAPPKPAVRTASAKPRPARGTDKADAGTDVTPEQPVDHTVPPPPAPAVRRTAVVAKVDAPPPPVVEVTPPPPPPPPPPQMTEEGLKNVTLGTRRAELLKLGAPASRITMIESGHLLEIYHYASREASLGVVRLNDGSVASVELR